jgi:hypothetical protein
VQLRAFCCAQFIVDDEHFHLSAVGPCRGLILPWRAPGTCSVGVSSGK